MKFDIQQILTAKYAKWMIIACISFFSLLIIFELSNFIFSPLIPLTSSSGNKNNASIKKEDSSQYILTSSLFGVYVPDNMNEASVKKSMLNVTLVGILLADKLEDSQVIIGSASGEQRTYKIGDAIPGGAKIEKITAAGVLVEHNGGLESLSLPKNDLTFEPVAEPLKEE